MKLKIIAVYLDSLTSMLSAGICKNKLVVNWVSQNNTGSSKSLKIYLHKTI